MGHLKIFLSLGTGYLLAMALLDLLPASYLQLGQKPFLSASLLIAGGLFVFLGERLVHRHKHEHKHGHQHSQQQAFSPLAKVSASRAPLKTSRFTMNHKACCSIESLDGLTVELVISAIACISVCAFFDGVTFGASILDGNGSHMRASLGVLAHVVPEIFLVGVLARSHYNSWLKTALFCGLGILLFVSGIVVSKTAAYFGASEGILLGLATGMMLYISIAHLIPKFLLGRREMMFAALGVAIFLGMELIPSHHSPLANNQAVQHDFHRD